MGELIALNRHSVTMASPSASPTPAWSANDLTYAAIELGREFPLLKADKIIAVVNRAACDVPLSSGRVLLKIRGRHLLKQK